MVMDGDNDDDNDGGRLPQKGEQPVLQLKQPPSGPPSETNDVCSDDHPIPLCLVRLFFLATLPKGRPSALLGFALPRKGL